VAKWGVQYSSVGINVNEGRRRLFFISLDQKGEVDGG
jgi:hypothetical protein